MKEQLQGIALILFGILLNGASAALFHCLPGEYPLIPCLFGIAIGLGGIFRVFSRESR